MNCMDGLETIPGIDTRRGLENAGSSLRIYREILALFRKDLAAKIPLLRKAAEGGDLESYTMMIHAFKGAARSVGAEEAGTAAARLETAARAGDTKTIAGATGPFLETLSRLGTAIDRAAAALQDSPARRDPMAVRADTPALQLPELRKALLDMDIETVNRITSGYGEFSGDNSARPLAETLKEDILLFEYGEAVKKIDAALARITGPL